GQLGAGPQAGEGANAGGAMGDHAFQVAMRLHDGAGGEFDVTQAAEGADTHAVAQHHPAFQHDVDVDLDVAAGVDFAAQVEAGGVGQAHAGAHQRLGGAALVHALQASQLQRIVGALGLAGDGAGGDGGRPALVAGDREDVGEVVLALGVVVAQGRQPAAQVGGRGEVGSASCRGGVG